MGVFQVITLFPNLVDNFLQEGVVGRACKKKRIEVTCINPRDFTQDNHQTVDDKPFGGGDGMIGLAEPFSQAIEKAKKTDSKTKMILLSPQGQKISDKIVKDWAVEPHLTLVCGRYGGIDQRLIAHHQMLEVSIGDYVLSGGELAALVIIDSVSRHIDGVLGHTESAKNETFHENLLESPQFTRPRVWQNLEVPEVLFSGDHKKILKWKRLTSLLITAIKRPDLFEQSNLKTSEKLSLRSFISELSDKDMLALGLKDEDLKILRDGALNE